MLACALADAQHITPLAAARRLGVERATVYRWIRSGALPAVRTPGRRYRIAVADLQLVFEPARREARDGPRGGDGTGGGGRAKP